jgi:hypothetical protein
MEGTWLGREFVASVQMNSLCTVEIEWPTAAGQLVARACEPYDPRSVDLAGGMSARTAITLPETTVEGVEARLRTMFGEHIPDLRSFWTYQSRDGEVEIEIVDMGPGRPDVSINVSGDDSQLLANYLTALTTSDLVVAAAYNGMWFKARLEPIAYRYRLLTYGKLVALLPYPTEDGCE